MRHSGMPHKQAIAPKIPVCVWLSCDSKSIPCCYVWGSQLLPNPVARNFVLISSWNHFIGIRLKYQYYKKFMLFTLQMKPNVLKTNTLLKTSTLLYCLCPWVTVSILIYTDTYNLMDVSELTMLLNNLIPIYMSVGLDGIPPRLFMVVAIKLIATTMQASFHRMISQLIH